MAFVNTGQTCVALTQAAGARTAGWPRQSRRSAGAVAAFPVGDPLDLTAFLGALASAAQRDQRVGAARRPLHPPPIRCWRNRFGADEFDDFSGHR
jgi:acyl-CoA reductase-like NAD-dependent aldehyde dehydrogenase